MVAIPSFRAQHMYMPWLSSSPPRSRRTNYPPARWYSFPKVNHVATSAGASPIYSRSTRGSHTRSTASAVLRTSGPTSSSNSLTPVPVLTPSPGCLSNLFWRSQGRRPLQLLRRRGQHYTEAPEAYRAKPVVVPIQGSAMAPLYQTSIDWWRSAQDIEVYVIGSSFPAKWSKSPPSCRYD